MLARAAVSAMVAFAALAAAADAASPPEKGARISGTTSQGQAVKGRVTSDGKSFQMTYAETFTCTDGRKFKLNTRYVNQRPSIKADGTVAYFKTYRNLPGLREFPGSHTERQRITGEFSGGRFSGRASASLSKEKRSCKSTIRLRLTVG